MEDKKLTLAPEVEEPETAEDTNELYIKFAKPYIFGDKTYTGIDLSGLEDVNGAVLKEAGRVVQKLNKGINPATVEMTMEYAVYMAHHVTNLPSDFFCALLTWYPSRAQSWVFSTAGMGRTNPAGDHKNHRLYVTGFARGH